MLCRAGLAGLSGKMGGATLGGCGGAGILKMVLLVKVWTACTDSPSTPKVFFSSQSHGGKREERERSVKKKKETHLVQFPKQRLRDRDDLILDFRRELDIPPEVLAGQLQVVRLEALQPALGALAEDGVRLGDQVRELGLIVQGREGQGQGAEEADLHCALARRVREGEEGPVLGAGEGVGHVAEVAVGAADGGGAGVRREGAWHCRCHGRGGGEAFRVAHVRRDELGEGVSEGAQRSEGEGESGLHFGWMDRDWYVGWLKKSVEDME